MLKKSKSIGTKVRRGALDTRSHETMEMIKAWIEQCVDGHPDCATSVQKLVVYQPGSYKLKSLGNHSR